MKFVAINLVLWSFFFMRFFARPIVCLTHLTASSKTGLAGCTKRALSSLGAFNPLVSRYTIHNTCFGAVCSWCEGHFLEFSPSPKHTPPLYPSPTSTAPSLHPQTPPLLIVQAVRTWHRAAKGPPSLPPPPPHPPLPSINLSTPPPSCAHLAPFRS